MSIKIKCYPASNGESFLIKLQGENTTNILIDSGYKSTAKHIIKDLEDIKNSNENLDLVILTHIDNDHINGARDILEYIINNNINVGEIWYNDYLKIVDMIESNDFPKNLNKEEIQFSEKLDQLSSIEYPEENNYAKKESVGVYTATCLIEYLMYEKLFCKWNKSFNYKCAYKNENKPRVNINNDVSIYMLGPNKTTLELLLKEWQDYIEKHINKYVNDKNIKIAKAFEKYMLVFKESVDAAEKCKCSNLDIDEMINYNTFDKDEINRSSIAIVIEFKDKKLLFLGDSSPIDIEQEIVNYTLENGKKFELFKVSHHGSRKNLSKKMIENIECENYLISTNGNNHNHPDIESIMKILELSDENKCIYLNYEPAHIISILKALDKFNEDEIYSLNKNVFEDEILIMEL